MRMLLSVAAGVVDGIIDMLQLILASAMPSFSTFQGTKAVTPGPSMWRALWNDIFSKVFRAVRSIVNGFMAFFTACNRHRLRFVPPALSPYFLVSLTSTLLLLLFLQQISEVIISWVLFCVQYL
jgi:hypothetical protein